MTNSEPSYATSAGAVLMCRAGTKCCGLDLSHVAETMRPLRIEPSPGTPSFVLGAARVRGEHVPVVDLQRLLGVEATPEAPRFVLLRVGARRVVLLVDSVVGVVSLGDSPPRTLPPLLRDARAASVAALAERDSELLFILESARLMPETQGMEVGTRS